MKDYKRILTCLTGTLLGFAFGFARPEPGAFLNDPAPNMAAIIHQLKTDPEVYSRYFRHYQMTQNQLAAYFATLKPAKITKAGLYRVYNEHEGVVRAKYFHLKVGSLIYVDAAGRPVMKKLCGNPMTGGPLQTSSSDIVQLPLTGSSEARIMDVDEPVHPVTPTELMVVEELAEPPFNPEPTPPIIVTPPVNPPTVTPPTTTPEPPVVKPSFEGPLAALPLLAGAFITTGRGGGSNEPVPEPTLLGAAALTLGFAGVARKKRK